MGALYNSGLHENDEVILGIKPGCIIAYRLLPEDMPINPNKTWRGIVKHCTTTGMQVEMLESSYSGLREIVLYEQVVGVE